MRERIGARMQAVLDHGQYIMGPEVAELEQRLSDYTGAKHAITCASGTEALLIALHRQPAHAQYGVEARLPVSEAVAAQVLSLPMYPDLTPAIQEQIAGAILDRDRLRALKSPLLR